MTMVSLYGLFSLTAQSMTTTEAKVVAMVDAGNSTITTLELFTDRHIDENALMEKYPDNNFYIGLMEGSYEVVKAKIRPQKGTTIIIFNNQTISGDTDIVFIDHYSPGDLTKIGRTEYRIISNNKGELILKTQ